MNIPINGSNRAAHEFAPRLHVLTGGPGSGKSSIIEGLRQRGFVSAPEAGRSVIQDQVAIGGRALPWSDRLLFAELMLSWDIRSYHAAEGQQAHVFFDRGIPDVLGYLRLSEIPAPEHMSKAAALFPYSRSVFIAPPWKDIFCQDRERKQDFAEAVRTYEALATVYNALKYDLIELPRVGVEERCEFILTHLGVKTDSRWNDCRSKTS